MKKGFIGAYAVICGFLITNVIIILKLMNVLTISWLFISIPYIVIFCTILEILFISTTIKIIKFMFFSKK